MTSTPPPKRQFASDNCAGICPAVWQAMSEANSEHAPSYGDDEWTRRAADQIRDVFDTDCEAFFVFNGTAANSLVLASLCRPYQSVIAHELAHVQTDACGSMESFSGSRIFSVSGEAGKVNVDDVRRWALQRSDVHYPKPRALTITQSTEVGTVYSVDELRAVCTAAHACDLRVHMDGARFANAVASLGVAPKELSWAAGVDVLSFGGTKNGMGVGDCVVFFDRELAKDFAFRRKQSGQLASKMRFLSSAWIGILSGDVWLDNARHANEMAQLLAGRLQELDDLQLAYPVQANAVFVRFPQQVASELRERGWRFEDFLGPQASRLMCAWDTGMEDVLRFVDDCRQTLSDRPV